MSKYIGINVHKENCHATIKDEKGRTLKQGEFVNSPSSLDEFFKGIGKAKVAIETGVL